MKMDFASQALQRHLLPMVRSLEKPIFMKAALAPAIPLSNTLIVIPFPMAELSGKTAMPQKPIRNLFRGKVNTKVTSVMTANI